MHESGALHIDHTSPELLKDSPSAAVTLNEKPSHSSIEKAAIPPNDEYHYDVHPKAGFITSIRMVFSTPARCVYAVVYAANLAIFLWVCSLYRHPENKLLNALWVGLPVMGNLFSGSQDHVVNLVLAPLSFIPPSWPLFLRRFAAGFLSVESIHAATSISGSVWLVLFTGHVTKEVIKGGPTTVPTLVITYVILAMLVVMLVLCVPAVQRILKNRFEYTHRYIAWVALVFVWSHVAVLDVDYKPKSQTLGQFWLTAPPFWMFLILTVSTIVPWANSRKVKCQVEVLSSDCIRLHLDGSAMYFGPRVPGAYARLSTEPFVNWHVYPMFFDRRRSEKGYSFIITRGDKWSSNLIDNPPNEIWTRGLITTGVMRIAPLFRRVLVVATGSGILIPAPHILSYDTPTKLLWIGQEMTETYGEDLVQSLAKRSDAVIHDSNKQGIVDVVMSVRRVVEDYKPEIVFIFSNKTVVKDVTIDLFERGGMAVYGTVCC